MNSSINLVPLNQVTIRKGVVMLPFPLSCPYPGGSGGAGGWGKTSAGSWSRWKVTKEIWQLNITSDPELNLGPERKKRYCWNSWWNLNRVSGLDGSVLSMVTSWSECCIVVMQNYVTAFGKQALMHLGGWWASCWKLAFKYSEKE